MKNIFLYIPIDIIMVYGNMNSQKYILHYVKPIDKMLLKPGYQKVDYYAGCKWLIYGTKHLKGNQLQGLELSCKISYWRIYIWYTGFPILHVDDFIYTVW